MTIRDPRCVDPRTLLSGVSAGLTAEGAGAITSGYAWSSTDHMKSVFHARPRVAIHTSSCTRLIERLHGDVGEGRSGADAGKVVEASPVTMTGTPDSLDCQAPVTTASSPARSSPRRVLQQSLVARVHRGRIGVNGRLRGPDDIERFDWLTCERNQEQRVLLRHFGGPTVVK